MGAQISSDGKERTVLARLIDPNGLLIEQTEGWESGTLTQAANEIANMHSDEKQLSANPQKVSQLAINVGSDPAGDFLTEEETRGAVELPIESIVDTRMSMIAPPALVRWMSTSSSTSSGEEIYEHRRSRSIGREEGQNLVSMLHRRAKSMSGYDFDTGSLQQPNV